MSRRDWKLFVLDMVESIQKVQDYLGNYGYADFLSDGKTQDAVVRNLEIIGEAARQILPEIRQKYPEIPWGHLVALRNRLTHGYFGVDPEIVWDIVQNELPQVKAKLEWLLGEERS